MNYIPLHITLISADVLNNVNLFASRMRVYAAVSLIGGPIFSRQRTPVDKHGGATPRWCLTMKFQVDASNMLQNRLMLVFQLRRRRTLGDKDVGFLYIPVKELFDDASAAGRKFPRHVAFTVSSRSGNPKGVLYLSYMFGALPSAPPCHIPSAPYLAAEECFPANPSPSPSAPYYEEDTSFF